MNENSEKFDTVIEEDSKDEDSDEMPGITRKATLNRLSSSLHAEATLKITTRD